MSSSDQVVGSKSFESSKVVRLPTWYTSVPPAFREEHHLVPLSSKHCFVNLIQLETELQENDQPPVYFSKKPSGSYFRLISCRREYVLKVRNGF
jgi:hypothetical protein